MKMQYIKRRFAAMALAVLPLLVSCKAVGQGQPDMKLNESQRRFQGVSMELVTDAVPGAEMLGVEFFADGRDRPFYAKSLLSRKTRERMSFPGGRIPEKVRVVWRRTHETYRLEGHIRYGGEIAGDYTIPVASRIPDAVLQDIKANGGGLRLKLRLKPDGVLFGWDIERAPAEERNYSREEIRAKNLYFPSEYLMVGGDFTETRY